MTGDHTIGQLLMFTFLDNQYLYRYRIHILNDFSFISTKKCTIVYNCFHIGAIVRKSPKGALLDSLNVFTQMSETKTAIVTLLHLKIHSCLSIFFVDNTVYSL